MRHTSNEPISEVDQYLNALEKKAKEAISHLRINGKKDFELYPDILKLIEVNRLYKNWIDPESIVLGAAEGIINGTK